MSSLLRTFLLSPLCLVMGLSLAQEKPNIILVLVDDMGWGDLNLNQNKKDAKVPAIMTPSLDKMAKGGVQLRRHYTAAPVCAPARASIFGGVHQGHCEVIRNNNFDAAIENSHTLATVLREAGYSTALIGKWGIGGGRERGGTPTTAGAWPTKRGFDYFFGYNNHIAGHVHYPKEQPGRDPDNGNINAIYDGDEVITDKLDCCYSTDLFTARAKKWIIDHRQAEPKKPFFLALTLTAPHARLAIPAGPYPKGGGLKGGLQWTGEAGSMINTAKGNWDSFIYPEYRNNKQWEKYAKERYPNNATQAIASAQRHASMITRIDDAMGDIVQLCRDLKIADNTFIVFTSDNGAHTEAGAVAGRPDHPSPAQNPTFFRSFGPLDGVKRDVWEGGLRVPCIVYAPGQVQGGLVSQHPSQFHDWMATFADLAQLPLPMRSDGHSLLPALRGNKNAPTGTVYAEYRVGGGMDQYPEYAPNKKGRVRGEQQVIYFSRNNKHFKAIRTDMKTGQEDFELYDVLADSHESKNLAAQFPHIQDELRAAVLYNRRAYDYKRDANLPKRDNGISGERCYDEMPLPALQVKSTSAGLQMRQVQASTAWVPAFDTLPTAKSATSSMVSDLTTLEFPAGTVTELKGYIEVPHDHANWHFYLKLNDVAGSKAYVKLHNANLIDADFNYTPGTEVSSSAAMNAVEQDAKATGKKGIPLQAGLHEVTIVVVQGESGAGKMELSWQSGTGEKKIIPAMRLRH